MSDSLAGPSSVLGTRETTEFRESPEAMKRAKLEHNAQDTIDEASVDLKPAEVENSGDSGDKSSKKRDAAGWPRSRKGKAKDTKNVGRRRRGTRNEEATSKMQLEEPSREQSPKPLRLPKRQSALLIGFCGTGCNGMQIQPNVRTIEGVLFEALVRAGAVSQDNADDPTKVSLGRAARTDAGVHAAGNLVSMKLITVIPGVKDFAARINEELPPEIRVWGYGRVQNSFNARMSCDSRKYTYFFPTYLLIPPKPGSEFHHTLQQHTESLQLSTGSVGPPHPFWSTVDVGSSAHEDDLLLKRKWRIGSEQVELLRETAKKFEGTHNFHNFTVGREFSDRSNQRHMKSIEISEPAVYGDTEWISVLFHGQSFMLHQIRKMMCALVLSCRTGTPSQIIDELYGPRMVVVPKMPALGLLLEYPIFDSYNSKVSSLNEKLEPKHPDYRPVIDFEQYRPDIDAFKQKHIYENMRAIEDRNGVFDAWIRSIDTYAGEDLLYLNPKGIIPASAVFKKGEKRYNTFKDNRRFDRTGAMPEEKDKASATDDEEIEEDHLSKTLLEEAEG